jgi:hypothetical protein
LDHEPRRASETFRQRTRANRPDHGSRTCGEPMVDEATGELVTPSDMRGRVTLDDADLDALAVEISCGGRGTQRRGRLETLAMWHREASFWREVYTRSIGGLGAGMGFAILALVAFSAHVEGLGTLLILLLSALLACGAGIVAFAAASVRRKRRGDARPNASSYIAFGAIIFVLLLVFVGLADKALVAYSENQRLEHRAACLARAVDDTQKDYCNQSWGGP